MVIDMLSKTTKCYHVIYICHEDIFQADEIFISHL
jgi:hypothetical protein